MGTDCVLQQKNFGSTCCQCFYNTIGVLGIDIHASNKRFKLLINKKEKHAAASTIKKVNLIVLTKVKNKINLK